MIDIEFRTSLQQIVKRLLLDRVKVSEFDDAFFFRYTSTDDEGVREVATLCHALYADARNNDREFLTLTGSGMRGTFARAFLFLRTDLEYEWHGDSVLPNRLAIWGVAILMLLPVLMGFIYFALPISVATGAAFLAIFSMLGGIGMFSGMYLISRHAGHKICAGTLANGDYEVWPFFRTSDLNQVAQES